MKKIFVKPTVQVFRVYSCPLLAGSILENDGNVSEITGKDGFVVGAKPDIVFDNEFDSPF